ncbi:MAG: ABC transporter substrate-binding protein, partial [Alphaproteobacteria bacterium]
MAAAIAAVASAAPTQAVEKVRLAQNQSPISGVSIIADRKGFFA